MKLAKRVAQISPSPTLEITAKAKKLKARGVDVVDFGAGEPDFDTPSFIKEAAVKAINDDFTKYTPSSGILELKEAITEKLKRDNGLSYDSSQIVVSCGAKHSLFNIILALCEEKDEVIIPSPYWVSYPEMVKIANGTPVILKTSQANDFKLTEEDLLGTVTERTKLLILNSPSNPTGSVYVKGELEVIAEIAKEKDFYIISDEIYEKLIYDGWKHTSIASLDDDIMQRTVLVNGVSKTYSMTGWRIGYLAGPGDLAQAVSSLQDHSTSNPTSISQKAALAALKGETEFVSKMATEFQKRRDLMVQELNRIEVLRPHNPRGAFYIFCDVSKTGRTGATFANELLERENVAAVPGEGFGCPTHIRLSFATSLESIKEGINRIARFVDTF